MSNRRKPKNQRQPEAVTDRDARRREHFEALKPWLWAMQDADEAEQRGDARGALDAMGRRWLDPEGQVYWRPSRITRLQQLALLDADAPGWMTSRWILEQAFQHLDEADRARGHHSRHQRAQEGAVAVRGGWDNVRGRDADDKRVQLRDRDWVYRQLHLFDFGGLEAFLDEAAAPDLVASADRVREWAQASMGGYTFFEASGAVLVGRDLATGETIQTPNLGTAAHLLPGEDVIGRLVPVYEDQQMFEGPVLYVRKACAAAVAADPDRWHGLLLEAVRRDSDGEIDTTLDWAGVASDLSIAATDAMFFVHPEVDPSETAMSVLDLAMETRRRLGDACPIHGEALDGDCGECLDAGWDGWAWVHAGLVQPAVMGALGDVVHRFDVQDLCDIREELAEPARSLLGAHISRIADAA